MTQSFLVITPSHAGLIRKALGKRLKHMSEARGYTRADLADMLDTTDLRIARIMKGSSDMTVPELVWAAKLLDCSIDHLTGRA